MEYIVVSRPKDRHVRIDGKVVGKTGQTLIVAAGDHKFELGGPYSPTFQTIPAGTTSAVRPLTINFCLRDQAPFPPQEPFGEVSG